MNHENNIIGWLLPSELRILASLAKTVPAEGLIVEVGSFMGRSSYCWATNAAPDVRVVCIDTFYEQYNVQHSISDAQCRENKFPLSGVTYNLKQEFQNNVCHLPNIIMHRGYSPQIEYNYGPIDLFFLDASHTNPNDWQNIEFFLPLIKQGGILCGHDYGVEYPDVLDNIDKCQKLLNQSVKLYPGTRLWSFTKS